MKNDVYRHMRSMSDSYEERTGRSVWEDWRNEVHRSDNPDWIKRYFKGEEDKA